MEQRKTAVIAFGGNALLKADQKGTQDEQIENAKRAADMMYNVYSSGYTLLVVHGNGPQVGNILIQQDRALHQIPPYTLDICGAMTEGSMGYMIERSLINRILAAGETPRVATVISEVVVDGDSDAFKNPTKPVGPFYPEFRAEELMRTKKWVMKEDSGRGWRKVVPSPKPIEVIQEPAIRTLLDNGHIVIAGGGGGIPVKRDISGYLMGVEAVIDKDYTSSLLARNLKADLFITLTGVDQVYADFGKPTQRALSRLSVKDARKMLAEGQFPAGSMGPKIESAVEYIESGGSEVLITSAEAIENMKDIEKVGTRIIP
ncbi:MAG: carbamate kinase [Acidobacteria bacterium]|nr:carbamate kinase [Acidobacteriota bacterium]